MGKIPELLENVILTGYCTYRMLIAIHLITQNAKYASENDVYGWIENHNWPELEIASAIMAMIGLLSGQRFIFCFTVFFFILRTAINITVVTIDLYTVKLFFHYLQNSVVCFSGYLIPVMISFHPENQSVVSQVNISRPMYSTTVNGAMLSSLFKTYSRLSHS
ncbi:unnamed protein product [Brugia timori]|uniref:Protein TEX261 n=1 Tax=Brugia timori TaxID=42155 RepID=A0A0R3RAA9_9BILA|nr:unnamed protein product [Brugia timori]